MYSLLLDLVRPGQPYRPRPRVNPNDHVGVGMPDTTSQEVNNVVEQLNGNDQLTDSVNDGGNILLDSLQQVGDTLNQVTDTLSQGQSMMMDSGAGGSSSSMLTLAIAVVALVCCLSLAIVYRRRMAAQA